MDKKFFYSMMLSMITVLGLQYYFSSSTGSNLQEVTAGQSFKAPVKSESRPLFKELDFVDAEPVVAEKLHLLENEDVAIQFSNHGGGPVFAELKKHKDARGNRFRMLDLLSAQEREQRSFALVMGDEAAAPYYFTVKQADQKFVEYEAKTKLWSIRKKYVLNEGKCSFDLELSLEPNTKNVEAVVPRLFVTTPLMKDVVENIDGINPKTSVIKDNQAQGFVQRLAGQSFEKVTATQEHEWYWVAPNSIGMEDRYTAHGLVADSQAFVKRAYFRNVFNTLQLILEGAPTDKKATWKMSFYMGPKTVESLSAVRDDLDSLLSFGWLSTICKFLLMLLQWLYQYFKNYGIAIILLTALIKIPFVPFMIFAKKRMEEFQRYQPSIEHIRNKYRNDVQKQHEEMMRFYKEHNLSPSTQMLGCLPLFLQMPVFFALYRVLANYIELYQAPFVGWIVDLSAKDPYYILPLLMGLTMLLQQIYTPVKDSRQRFVMLFMPFVMTAIFVNFPAGLVLYWLFNNIFTMIEDSLRRMFFA